MIAALLLSALCSCSAPLDAGQFERFGVTVHQDEYPVTTERDEGVDAQIVDEAIGWWNDQLDREVFALDGSGEVTITINLISCLPDGECPEGVARVGFNWHGEIESCDVVLSSDISYNRFLLLHVLKHELGHCLGLEDDPPGLGLNSIMSDPPPIGGVVTEHDRGLLDEQR